MSLPFRTEAELKKKSMTIAKIKEELIAHGIPVNGLRKKADFIQRYLENEGPARPSSPVTKTPKKSSKKGQSPRLVSPAAVTVPRVTTPKRTLPKIPNLSNMQIMTEAPPIMAPRVMTPPSRRTTSPRVTTPPARRTLTPPLPSPPRLTPRATSPVRITPPNLPSPGAPARLPSPPRLTNPRRTSVSPPTPRNLNNLPQIKPLGTLNVPSKMTPKLAGLASLGLPELAPIALPSTSPPRSTFRSTVTPNNEVVDRFEEENFHPEGEEIIREEREEPLPPTLEGQTIVFSGFRDDALKNEISNRGGRVTTAVSGKTTIVVLKNGTEPRGKTLEAMNRGVPVLQLSQFKEDYGL